MPNLDLDDNILDVIIAALKYTSENHPDEQTKLNASDAMHEVENNGHNKD